MLNFGNVAEDDLDYMNVCSISEISNGERLFFEIHNYPVVLVNIAGLLYAIGDVCTHDNGPLGDGGIEDKTIICPRHGARFDLETVKAVRLPAIQDIPAYPVSVVDGKVQIGIPK